MLDPPPSANRSQRPAADFGQYLISELTACAVSGLAACIKFVRLPVKAGVFILALLASIFAVSVAIVRTIYHACHQRRWFALCFTLFLAAVCIGFRALEISRDRDRWLKEWAISTALIERTRCTYTDCPSLYHERTPIAAAAAEYGPSGDAALTQGLLQRAALHMHSHDHHTGSGSGGAASHHSSSATASAAFSSSSGDSLEAARRALHRADSDHINSRPFRDEPFVYTYDIVAFGLSDLSVDQTMPDLKTGAAPKCLYESGGSGSGSGDEQIERIWLDQMFAHTNYYLYQRSRLPAQADYYFVPVYDHCIRQQIGAGSGSAEENAKQLYGAYEKIVRRIRAASPYWAAAGGGGGRNHLFMFGRGLSDAEYAVFRGPNSVLRHAIFIMPDGSEWFGRVPPSVSPSLLPPSPARFDQSLDIAVPNFVSVADWEYAVWESRPLSKRYRLLLYRDEAAAAAAAAVALTAGTTKGGVTAFVESELYAAAAHMQWKKTAIAMHSAAAAASSSSGAMPSVAPAADSSRGWWSSALPTARTTACSVPTTTNSNAVYCIPVQTQPPAPPAAMEVLIDTATPKPPASNWKPSTDAVRRSNLLDMAYSRFCGVSSGRALFQSIAAGCIPVWINDSDEAAIDQQRTISFFPFQHAIDWTRLSLRWPQTRPLSSLVDYLRSLPTKVVAQYHAAVLHIRPFLQWLEAAPLPPVPTAAGGSAPAAGAEPVHHHATDYYTAAATASGARFAANAFGLVMQELQRRRRMASLGSAWGYRITERITPDAVRAASPPPPPSPPPPANSHPFQTTEYETNRRVAPPSPAAPPSVHAHFAAVNAPPAPPPASLSSDAVTPLSRYQAMEH